MIGNLPNILTFARILLLPFFAASLMYKRYDYSLVIFIAASITDLFDGFIARIKKQITYFGSILDPVADKFFLVTSFILMSYYELIPMWLTIIVISKDIIVITGCIIIYLVTDSLKIEPSLAGKYACASQFILIGLVLFTININEKVTIPLFLYAIVALLTALSGLHYVYKGLKIANLQNT